MAVGESVVGLALVALASVLILLQAIEARFVLRSTTTGVGVLDPPTVIRPSRRAAASAVPIPDELGGRSDFRGTVQPFVIIGSRPSKRHAADLCRRVRIATHMNPVCAGHADAALVPLFVRAGHAVNGSPIRARGQREAAVRCIVRGDAVGIDRVALGGTVKNLGHVRDISPQNDTIGGFDIGVGHGSLERVEPVAVVQRIGHGGDAQLALIGLADCPPTRLLGLRQSRQQHRSQDRDDGDDDQQLDKRKAFWFADGFSQFHVCDTQRPPALCSHAGMTRLNGIPEPGRGHARISFHLSVMSSHCHVRRRKQGFSA